jgi:hypothetical protein
VRLVLAAAVTELLELETAGGRLLVLRSGVIAFLALSALQCDDFPHLVSFSGTKGLGTEFHPAYSAWSGLA